MAGIELINVHKQYLVEDRAVQVLNGISLQVPSNRITVILGRSGCGKTTLLRLTGGLEKVDQGEIRYGESHRTAFVFQDAQQMSRTDKVIVGILVIGMVGYVTDRIFALAISKLLKGSCDNGWD